MLIELPSKIVNKIRFGPHLDSEVSIVTVLNRFPCVFKRLGWLVGLFVCFLNVQSFHFKIFAQIQHMSMCVKTTTQISCLLAGSRLQALVAVLGYKHFWNDISLRTTSSLAPHSLEVFVLIEVCWGFATEYKKSSPISFYRTNMLWSREGTFLMTKNRVYS